MNTSLTIKLQSDTAGPPPTPSEYTTILGPAKVLFDPECSVCRNFAHFIGKLTPPDQIIFAPSSDTNPKELVVTFKDNEGSDDWLSGISAWEWLLAHHPTLSGLGWMAEKLFIKRPAAVALSSGAQLLRRLCGRCR
ncbi:MAG: hypothetical protein NTV34_21515 [Proteobacteria bacterium]|nr:hypothetical protein [Pseudomonadota bacterium]